MIICAIFCCAESSARKRQPESAPTSDGSVGDTSDVRHSRADRNGYEEYLFRRFNNRLRHVTEFLLDSIDTLNVRLEQAASRAARQEEMTAQPRQPDSAAWSMSVFSPDSSLFQSPGMPRLAGALRDRCDAICIVYELDSILNRTYTKIDGVLKAGVSQEGQPPVLTPRLKLRIRTAIDPAVKKMDALLTRLERHDKAMFTEEQQAYINNLKKRYNALAQYYITR